MQQCDKDKQLRNNLQPLPASPIPEFSPFPPSSALPPRLPVASKRTAGAASAQKGLVPVVRPGFLFCVPGREALRKPGLCPDFRTKYNHPTSINMAGTIFPILARCPLTGADLFALTQSERCNSEDPKLYDGKKVFDILTREYGWEPVYPGNTFPDSVCINHSVHQDGKRLLDERILPDGSKGYVWDYAWDWNADQRTEGEYLLVHAQEYGEETYILTGFTRSGGKALLQYASQEDLNTLYRYSQTYVPGVMETASIDEEKSDFHKAVPPDEKEYIRNAYASCRSQGFEFDALVFSRVVPVHVENFGN